MLHRASNFFVTIVMPATLGIGTGGPCTYMCTPGRKNCEAGCCACVDDNYNTGIHTRPGGLGDPSNPEPDVVSSSQNVLTGVTFPSLNVNGFENIMNGVTGSTLPGITGVNFDSLIQNVTVPSIPSTNTPATSTNTPATSESSLNWLWVLVVIPLGIAAVAISKSK
jgi:hypothetical protein